MGKFLLEFIWGNSTSQFGSDLEGSSGLTLLKHSGDWSEGHKGTAPSRGTTGLTLRPAPGEPGLFTPRKHISNASKYSSYLRCVAISDFLFLCPDPKHVGSQEDGTVGLELHLQVLCLTEALEFKLILTKARNITDFINKNTDVPLTCIFYFPTPIKGCLILKLFNLRWETLAGKLERNSSVLQRRRGRSALTSRRLMLRGSK